MNLEQFFQIEMISYPDWLLDMVLTEPNVGDSFNPEIHTWVTEHLLKTAIHYLGIDSLKVISHHSHVGTDGLDPHDHLPHAFTSVLWLDGSDGDLVIHLPDGKYHYVTPEKGRMVIFPADLVHHVESSPDNQLRVSLVCNYDYTRL